MNRAIWKWYYRQLRIAQRESHKAAADALAGIGFVRVDDDGFVNHIRPEAIYILDPEAVNGPN